MEALIYIYQRTLINKIKKAFRKPVTIIYLIGIIAYGLFIIFSFNSLFTSMEIATPRGLVGLLTMFIFLTLPSNIVSYVKRKGLIFKPSDVHFIFPAPFSPKIVLLFAHTKGVFMGLGFGLAMTIAGVVWFHMPIWKMLLYFLVVNIIEQILEASLVVLLYGNERISEKTMKKIPWLMYAFIIAIIVYIFLTLLNQGFSMENAINAVFMEELQWIPIVGWCIAMLHLLFIGPTTLNVICTILFFISSILFLCMAKRMKCTGEYYEHAMKFADDYEEARNRSKKGEIAVIGKKKKYKQADIIYKGHFAKAIFYRQLLEYKKNKFFIFGFVTLVNVGISIGIVVAMMYGFEDTMLEYKEFILPGIMAYIALIFSGFTGKWAKELVNPYTYLIPDTSFHKLWYATLMEHIRSFIDACLLVIPAGFALGITPFQIILTIFIYVCVQANKLYIMIMIEGWLGNLLGNTPKQLLKTTIFMSIIGVGAIVATIGTILIGVEAGFIMMIIIMMVITLGCMFVASGIFDRMEVE